MIFSVIAAPYHSVHVLTSGPIAIIAAPNPRRVGVRHRSHPVYRTCLLHSILQNRDLRHRDLGRGSVRSPKLYTPSLLHLADCWLRDTASESLAHTT